MSDTVIDKVKKPKIDTRKKAAKEANVSERKVSYAQTIKKAGPEVPDMVRGYRSVFERDVRAN